MLPKKPESYIAEVFGFPSDVRDPDIERLRALKLCPFRPIHPKAQRDLSTPESVLPFDKQFSRCTKDSKTDPLGVCSVYAGGKPAITCPVRFTEGDVMLQITKAWAGSVIGIPANELNTISEVRLVPASPLGSALAETVEGDDDEDLTVPEVVETSAGNIDYVVAHIDVVRPGSTLITDYNVNTYAALEVQAVYISGNVRQPFIEFMGGESWVGINPPRPDWLSSSRKRLVPQLAWKGSILHEWKRPIAVCVQDAFWQTMPFLINIAKPADHYQEMAWIIIDLYRQGRIFRLQHVRTMYSGYDSALAAATKTPAGVDRLVRGVIIKKYIKNATGKKHRLPSKKSTTRKKK